MSLSKTLRNHFVVRDVGVAGDDFANIASGATEDMNVATNLRPVT